MSKVFTCQQETEIFYCEQDAEELNQLDLKAKRRQELEDSLVKDYEAETEIFEAGAELDRIVQRMQTDRPGLSYEQCLGIAIRDNPKLTARAFPTKRL